MAINDPFLATDYLIYLLKYDSAHGRFAGEIQKIDEDNIKVNGQKIRIFREKDASKIGWGGEGAEYVAESSGVFLDKEKAQHHLNGGAKKVIMSAPPKDDTPILVMGVNH
jgi:glyceraldehyde 3-phosphate dehydrogenase